MERVRTRFVWMLGPAMLAAFGSFVTGADGPITIPAPEPIRVDVGGRIQDVQAAGDGRYLIVSTGDALRVVDVAARKVIGQVPLGDEQRRERRPLYAANREELFLYSREQGLLSRYRLDSLVREQVVSLDLRFDPASLVTGCSAWGPLLFAATNGEMKLLNSTTLQLQAEHPARPPIDWHSFLAPGTWRVRAAANGAVCTYHWAYDETRNQSPNHEDGASTVGNTLPLGHPVDTGRLSAQSSRLRQDGQIKLQSNGLSFDGASGFGMLLPDGQGTRVYCLDVIDGETGLESYPDHVCLPAATGSFWVKVPTRLAVNSREASPRQKDIEFFDGPDRSPILVMTRVSLPPLGLGVVGQLANEQRVVLLPTVSTLAVVDDVERGMLLYPCDVLAAASQRRPQLNLTPKQRAIPGETWRHDLDLRSALPATLAMAAGPVGMTLENGVMSWQVPHDAAGEIGVLLTVNDTTERPTYWYLRFPVGDEWGPSRGVTFVGSVQASLGRPAPGGDAWTVSLPSRATSQVLAAKGRLLVAHLPAVRQLAVVDLDAGRVAGFIPIPEDDDVLFAAGATRLVVWMRGQRRVARWNLNSLELESVAVAEDRALHLAMGIDSEGPLGVVTKDEYRLLDLDSLGELAVHRPPTSELSEDEVRYWNGCHCSADGGVFAMYNGELGVAFRDGKRYRFERGAEFLEEGAPLVSGDGRSLFSYSGVISLDQPTFKTRRAGCFPACRGSLNLVRRREGASLPPAPGEPRPPLVSMEVRTNSDESRLCAVDAEASVTQWLDQQRELVAFDPDAKRLVAMGDGSDTIEVHRFDVEALLAAAGEYLCLDSLPPARLAPGVPFSHPIKVRSSSPQVEYRLESAPQGMQVSPEGLLTWAQPVAGHATAVLSIKAPGGRELLRRLEFEVAEPQAAPEPPPGVAAKNLRRWTERNDGRTIDGAFLDVDDKQVRIITERGKVLALPLVRLSADDLVWVIQHSQTESAERSASAFGR